MMLYGQVAYSAIYEQNILAYKNLKFFEANKESFKRMKIVSSDAFRKYSSAKAEKASFEIAYCSGKETSQYRGNINKTTHAKSIQFCFEEANWEELAKISLSDPTEKTRIDEIGEDIEL